MIRVLQANMNRSKTADDLLTQLKLEKGADILIISEQYQNKNSEVWLADNLGTAAMWIANPTKILAETRGAGNGFVWFKNKNTTYISCYLTPNQSIQEYKDKLEELEDNITQMTGSIVLAGDFNAKAIEWGMPQPDSRGRLILEMAARQSLIVMNTGNSTTFRRPGYTETIPDITLVSEDLVSKVKGWTVIEDFTGSDHQYIYFELSEERRHIRNNSIGAPRWNVAQLDHYKLQTVLQNRVDGITRISAGVTSREQAEEVVTKTMDLIQRACREAVPIRGSRINRKAAYWWNDEIAQLRRTCLQLRRRAQRERNRPDADAVSTDYRNAKKILRTTIRQSKMRCWNNLREEVNLNPWGLGYKIVTQRLKNSSAQNMMETETMENIVNTLFPDHPKRIEENNIADLGVITEFSVEELMEAAKSIKNRKAAGPDGIPGEVVKAVATSCPQLLLNMYNICLNMGLFSARWKIARLVLVSKGKGDLLSPSSYRPLCMLDTTGKLLEKMLKKRLNTSIQEVGGLASRQFGFRKGCSTIDAVRVIIQEVERAERGNHHSRKIILLVTLDVKNAFNSARWVDILAALSVFNTPAYLLRIMEDYLKDRLLLYETVNGSRAKEITAGAAQGSILGPDLWNIMYDGLLRIEMPDDTLLDGYADDVAAVILARDIHQAQLKLNQVMRRVTRWMKEHGLSLATEKTEIVILTKKRIPTIVPLQVGTDTITTTAAVKHLGITLDTKLTYWQHVKQAADKAAIKTNALARLMANIKGPASSKRKLLMDTTQSIMLYGAEIWADAMKIEKYRKRIAAVQRRGALRVACSYRTVSEPAVMVIAGVIPIDLLALERKSVFERDADTSREIASAQARRCSIIKWQERWNNEHRGRWTARLIPQIDIWINRKHGDVNYYITQFLSGHGYFRTYLHRMGKVNSPVCRHCGEANDDVVHTFFECDLSEQQRQNLIEAVGPVTPENIVGIMLQAELNWNAVALFVETVLRNKKQYGYTEDLDET